MERFDSKIIKGDVFSSLSFQQNLRELNDSQSVMTFPSSIVSKITINVYDLTKYLWINYAPFLSNQYHGTSQQWFVELFDKKDVIHSIASFRHDL